MSRMTGMSDWLMYSVLPEDHRSLGNKAELAALSRTIEHPKAIGLDAQQIKEAASLDDGIAEFCRFYLERREYEIERTDDERKRKKLHDEFTPSLK